jgi:NAD(P)-dependent dehydrogenase (short-subunit alcohol dehydrogenase family)
VSKPQGNAPEAKHWAVVLGASSGTGAAIARQVARDPGLHVFGLHRGHYPDLAEGVARDVRASGQRVHLRCGDAGTPEGASAGADELLEVAGRRSVRLMVHSIANAAVGLLASGGEAQLRVHQVHKTFDAMAHSFVYWTQELLARDLLAPGAQLLGLTNPMDELVVRNTALIGATKAALAVYVRHLAHELGPLGYRVNLIRFGAVRTHAVERTFGEARLAVLEQALQRSIPARRLCTLEEVARLVAVLAGDTLSWFNGAIIDFTGSESQGFFDTLLEALREKRDG